MARTTRRELRLHRAGRTHTKRRLVAATTVGLMLLGSAALADSLEGDQLVNGVTVRVDGTMDLGDVCVGQDGSGTLSLAIRKSQGGANTYANNAVVTVSPESATSGLTAGTTSGNITIPADWNEVTVTGGENIPGAQEGTLSPIVTAQITLNTAVIGQFDGSVTYKSSGIANAGPNPLTRTDEVPVTANVIECATDTGRAAPAVANDYIDNTLTATNRNNCKTMLGNSWRGQIISFVAQNYNPKPFVEAEVTATVDSMCGVGSYT